MPEDAAAAPAPAAGDSVVFGHFHVPRRADGKLWELGRGAMGVTYRAFDTGLRVEVALKVIAADKVADANTRARFQREARAAAKIRHPNVASVLHLGEQGGEFFYAMEFIEGRSLAALLQETAGPLPPPVAVGLAAQVAAALNAAHRKEVLHRDLKPANLMLLEGDAVDHEDERTEAAGRRQLKVIDFGLARRFGAGRQEDSFVTQSIVGFIGTPAYASPEQAGGDGELDGRSDLYSLGVILWEMLTGKLPFTGNPMLMLSRHLTQAPPFEQLAGLPPVVVGLLMGLMEKEAAQRRPQSAAELRLALDDALRVFSPVAAVYDRRGEAPATPQAPAADGHRPPLQGETAIIEPGTTLLERYRLGREVGHGDGGRLYLAADNHDGGHPVALKLLPPERVAAEPGFMEATQAAIFGVRQNPHPVLLAHDAGQLQATARSAFYVREWAEGFSLVELLRARGALRAAEVFRLLETLPGILDHAAANADAFPWLETTLGKLFVAPPAPGGSVPHPDWPGLRSRPVEGWPEFALRLNPLGFPPAGAGGAGATATGSGGAEVTLANNAPGSLLSGAGTPVFSLAQLVRELLGAPAGGRGPLTGLNDAANAVLARGRVPGAFADATAFWAALQRAVAPAAPVMPPPLEPVPVRVRPVWPDPVLPSVTPNGRPPGRVPVWAWVLPLIVVSVLAVVFLMPSVQNDRRQAVATPTPAPTAVPILATKPTPTPRPTLTPTPTEAGVAKPDFRNATGVDLVWIRPGSFTMGSPASEEGRSNDETAHPVTLTRGYWLGRYEVRQALYQEIMGTNPSSFKNAGADAPVESVSWGDAKAFCAKLTERERRAGMLPAGFVYGLPTEAQWEYGARAGTTGAFGIGNGKSLSSKQANFDGNSPYGIAAKGAYLETTVAVGSYEANAWGLYDMHGNVWEWCEDWKGDYPAGSVTDPTGPKTGVERVLRGGSWFNNARYGRAAYRNANAPGDRSKDLGFRLALVPSGP